MMKKLLLSWMFLGLCLQAEETKEKAISGITVAAQAFLGSLSPELKG